MIVRVRGGTVVMNALGAIGIWTCVGRARLFRLAPP